MKKGKWCSGCDQDVCDYCTIDRCARKEGHDAAMKFREDVLKMPPLTDFLIRQAESDDLLDTSSDFTRPEDTQIGGDHYRTMTVQPWEAMSAWMSQEAFVGFLRGNIIKYAARCDHKDNMLEDLQKARHYLDKLISVLEDAK